MRDRGLFITLSSGLYGGEKCLLGMIDGLPAISSIEPVVVVPAPGRLTAELDRRKLSWVVHAMHEPRSRWKLPSDAYASWQWLRELQPRFIYMNANTYWRPLELGIAAAMGIPVVTHHHLVPQTLPPSQIPAMSRRASPLRMLPCSTTRWNWSHLTGRNRIRRPMGWDPRT
jgi:hypothetical protein